MVEKVTIIIAILSIIYLGIRAFMGSLSAHALIYYMLEKKYTPPTPKEMEECQKEIAFRWFNLK